LYYEKGAKITWPSGGKAATATWGWPGTDIQNSRPKGPQQCTGKITLLGDGAELCAQQCPTSTATTATAKDPSAVAIVVASAGGGTLSQQQLTDAGVTNTGLSEDEIVAVETAIANAYTCPIDSCSDWLAARTGTVWTPCPGNPTWIPAASSASCTWGAPIANGEGNSTFLSLSGSTTTAELQALTDKEVAAVASRKAAEAVVAAAVAEVVTNAGGGTLSQQQLTDAGITNTGLSEDEIDAVEAAITAASPSDSTTTAELQALTDTGVATVASRKAAEIAVAAAVAEVVANAGGGTLSQQQLTDAGVTNTGLSEDEIDAVEAVIAAASLSDSTTTAELQALADTVVTTNSGEGIVVAGDQGSGSGSGEVADIPVAPSNVPEIVVGVAGGAVFLVLLSVLFIFCIKKQDDSKGEGDAGGSSTGDDSRVVENPLFDTKE
jgi:hypothetical protein